MSDFIMSWLTAHRFARVALAAVVVVTTTAVGFASGYHQSESVLGNGSAYLQKDHSVVRVNSDTGYIDASVDAEAARKLATGTQRLEVVQVRPGLVYVVNNETGEAWRLPTDTMKLEQIDKRPGSSGRLKVEAGGDHSYLVDAERGTASKLDGGSGPGVEIPLPGKIDQLVVADSGVGWAYSPTTGELYEVIGERIGARLRVAGLGEHVVLTLAANQPVLYHPATGQAAVYDRDGLVRRLDLAAENGLVAMPSARDAVVVFVPRTGEFVVADTGDGDIRRTLVDRRGNQNRFGRPVIFHGRAYLPDYTYHHVVIVDLAGPKVVSAEPVPGTSRPFDVFVRDGLLWISDPYDKTVITFDKSGHKSESKTDGSGGGHNTASPKPSTSPSAGPSYSPSPTARPKPETMVVPNVVGQDRMRACQRLRPLRCQQVARPDGDGQTGIVLSTNPPAGSRVTVGSRITVFYRGPAEAPTGLIGMTAADACTTIRSARLKCVEKVEGVAATAPQAFIVTAQNPPAGAKINTGSDVTITYAANVLVPAVTGAAVAQACATLESTTHAFRCVGRDLGSAAGTGQPAGVVISQTPAANAGAPRNSNVVISYYGNNNTTVPSVVGAGPDQACAALAAHHLGCARNDNAATNQLGIVHVQSHAPGSVVAAGTPVTITYETTGSLQMLRWKAPAPSRANFIAVSGGGPGGWSQQASSAIGLYAPGTTGVPGLWPIYRYRCTGPCNGSYYYSANAGGQPNYVMEGEAFRCFDPKAVNTGKQLHALFLDDANVWVWAVPGTGEWNTFHQSPIKWDFVVCNVW